MGDWAVSESEWNGLRMGDVVIERRSRTPRIVLGVSVRPFKQGPRKGQPCHYITMRKLHAAGRECEMTSLLPSDWRHRLDLAHGKHIRVTQGMQWCERHGHWHFGGTEAHDFTARPLHPLPRSRWKKPGLAVERE